MDAKLLSLWKLPYCRLLITQGINDLRNQRQLPAFPGTWMGVWSEECYPEVLGQNWTNADASSETSGLSPPMFVCRLFQLYVNRYTSDKTDFYHFRWTHTVYRVSPQNNWILSLIVSLAQCWLNLRESMIKWTLKEF